MTTDAQERSVWWYGTTEGISDDVPTPWTALEVTEADGSIEVSPSLRTYRFGPCGFIEQVQAQGDLILDGPVQVVAQIGGQKQQWTGESVSLGQASAVCVCMTQLARSDALELQSRTSVEVDGVIRVDWKILPLRPVVLERLELHIPLKKQHAMYYYHCPGTWGVPDAGELKSDRFTLDEPIVGLDKKAAGNIVGFQPMVWLGDNERGLAWFSESDKNWYTQAGQPVTEIVTEGDRVTLKLHLVSTSLQLAPGGASSEQEQMASPDGPIGDLAYTFGFQATPVRPAGDDVWDHRIVHIDANTFGPTEMRLKIPESVLDRCAELGVKTICFHEHWTDAEGYYATTHGEDFRNLVEACHARGIQFLPYLGFIISELADEFPQVGKKCIVLPEYSITDTEQGDLQGGVCPYRPYHCPPQPSQDAYLVCYNSPWQDAIVAGIGKLMDDYGVDGVYLDGTSHVHACLNGEHGCGYLRPDGTRAFSFKIFAVRNIMRRIYQTVQKRDPRGQINVHNSTSMLIPALGWSSSYWDGEQFGANFAPETFALDALPLDSFRAEFMGHNWGVPAEFLCRRACPFNREQAYAISLLHDVLVREGYENHCELLELQSKLWGLSDQFGRKQAHWLPYWRNGELVCTSPDAIYSSLYVHDENGVLAVVSNLGRETVTATVRLELGKIGLGSSPVSARDAITDEAIEIAKGAFQVPLGSLEWKIVWVNRAIEGVWE